MDNEYKLKIDNLKEQIKYLAALQGMTMTKLKDEINHRYNKTDGVCNLNNKLRNKTFRVSELVEILDILNYEIILRKVAS